MHPDLVKVVRLAYDLLQPVARASAWSSWRRANGRSSAELVAAGASKIRMPPPDRPRGRPGDGGWRRPGLDFGRCTHILGDVMREASVKLDIPIVWGGVDRRIDDLQSRWHPG